MAKNTASTIIKQGTVLDAIRWLRASWDEASESTIHNCFRKCTFCNCRARLKKLKAMQNFEIYLSF